MSLTWSMIQFPPARMPRPVLLVVLFKFSPVKGKNLARGKRFFLRRPSLNPTGYGDIVECPSHRIRAKRLSAVSPFQEGSAAAKSLYLAKRVHRLPKRT